MSGRFWIGLGWATALSLVFWSLLFLALSGCGCDPPEGAVDVRVAYPERVAALEACAGAAIEEPVWLVLAPAGPSPTSGRRCCLAEEPARDCGDGLGPRCGVAGHFETGCRVLTLPDECDDALEHELLHALGVDRGQAAACE